MANIGSVLKSEISRLCRREIRSEVAAIKKASASHRRSIAALKRQLNALQRTSAALERRAKAAPAPTPIAPQGRPVRFVAKGLRSLRSRLGLSAPQLARLLGVSEQSVYNWETKKATPRKEQLAGIIALRGLGKREAHARLLQATKSQRPKRGRKTRRE